MEAQTYLRHSKKVPEMDLLETPTKGKCPSGFCEDPALDCSPCSSGTKTYDLI